MATPPKGNYDKKTADAIDRYASGSHLRNQMGDSKDDQKDRNGQLYLDPELRSSPQARSGLGFYEQGEGMRRLRKSNPDLTDLGAKQTMKVGAQRTGDEYADIDSYKKGGKVRKTGISLLHRGEKARSGKRFSGGRR